MDNNITNVKNDTKFDLEIRPNKVLGIEKCAICGGNTDLQLPLSIFKRGTDEPICHNCADRYYPEAANAIYGDSDRSYVYENAEIPLECAWRPYCENEFTPKDYDTCIVLLSKNYANLLVFERDFKLSRYASFTMDCALRDIVALTLPYCEAQNALRNLGYKMEDYYSQSAGLYFHDLYAINVSDVRHEYWTRDEIDSEKQSDNDNQ